MRALRHWSVRHASGLWSIYRLLSRLATRLAPLARLIGARRSEALLLPVERMAKGVMFDCSMCGECALAACGLSCPMNCAKRMRNGPCGGVRPDGMCEVDATMRCVWLEAGEGQQRIGERVPVPRAQPLPPPDQRRQGRSSWIRVIQGDTVLPPAPAARTASESRRAPASRLESALRRGEFAVTVEIAPPDSADPQPLIERAARFRGLVHAINITDGAGGNCHMSSVAAASVLAAQGIEPVCQVACRDRNRIAVQGDALGAAALGVRNVLCLTGDDVSQGDHPQAKPVFDLDAVSLLDTLRGMRDRGEYASGRRLLQAPQLFLGASANPFAPPYADRVYNLERKIAAGAEFIQTQFCFDLRRFDDFMRLVRERGLHRRAAIIVGVGTLSSAKALRWMAAHVPGVHVPEDLLRRIESAADQKAEGQRICLETIEALRRIEGVAGVHLMGHRNEDVLASIIEASGLRPQADPQ